MVRSSGAHQQRTESTIRIILDAVPIRVCVCWFAASQSLAPPCLGLLSKLLRRGNRNLRLKGRVRARPDKFRSLTFECPFANRPQAASLPHKGQESRLVGGCGLVARPTLAAGYWL